MPAEAEAHGGTGRRGLTGWPYLLLCAAVLAWAGNFVLGRAFHADIHPVSLAFWRWTVATAVLLPFAGPVAWKHRRVIAREWRLVGLLAFLGIVVFHICVYSGLQSVPATNAALLHAAVPVIIPVFSYVILGDAVSNRQVLGIFISCIGVAVIILRGEPGMASLASFGSGDAWILVSVPVWALYSVMLRRVPSDLPRLALLMTIAVLGVFGLAPLYALERSMVGGFDPSAVNLLAIAYVAVFASVIAYVCWNQGVMEVGPNKAGLFMHLMPVFATVLAVLLLGETLQPYHAVGVIMIGIGLLLTTTGNKKAARVKLSG